MTDDAIVIIIFAVVLLLHNFCIIFLSVACPWDFWCWYTSLGTQTDSWDFWCWYTSLGTQTDCLNQRKINARSIRYLIRFSVQLCPQIHSHFVYHRCIIYITGFKLVKQNRFTKIFESSKEKGLSQAKSCLDLQIIL